MRKYENVKSACPREIFMFHQTFVARELMGCYR